MQIASSVSLVTTTVPKGTLPDAAAALVEIGSVLQNKASSEPERVAAMHRYASILSSGAFFEYSAEDRKALSETMEKSDFLTEARSVGDRFRRAVATASDGAPATPAQALAIFNRLSSRDQLLVQAEGGLGDQTAAEWKATLRVQAQIYDMEIQAERGQVDPRLSQVQALAKQLTTGRAKETNAWTQMMESFFAKTGWSRSPTHKPHPQSGGSEFDEGQEVFGVLFVAAGDGAKMLEVVEETLDGVAAGVGCATRAVLLFPVWHGFDAAADASAAEVGAQGVAVVAGVGDQRLAGFERAQHVAGAPSVVRLAGRQLERDWQAVGIDHRMDFRRQSAARAPHASGVNSVPSGGKRGFGAVLFRPFLPFAACWWTRTEVESIICASPA